MSLYYEDDHVRLFHGDCLEITDWLGADVLVTDPPYGIAYESNRNRDERNTKMGRPVGGDSDLAVRDAVLDLWKPKPAVVFGRWDVHRPAPRAPRDRRGDRGAVLRVGSGAAQPGRTPLRGRVVTPLALLHRRPNGNGERFACRDAKNGGVPYLTPTLTRKDTE